MTAHDSFHFLEKIRKEQKARSVVGWSAVCDYGIS